MITASNPDVAFDADGPLPAVFGGVKAGRGNNGRLTFPANLHGNPAVSIPAGTLDGLPIGLQVVGRHFTEELLLDIALHRRARPGRGRSSPRPPDISEALDFRIALRGRAGHDDPPTSACWRSGWCSASRSSRSR